MIKILCPYFDIQCQVQKVKFDYVVVDYHRRCIDLVLRKPKHNFYVTFSIRFNQSNNHNASFLAQFELFYVVVVCLHQWLLESSFEKKENYKKEQYGSLEDSFPPLCDSLIPLPSHLLILMPTIAKNFDDSLNITLSSLFLSSFTNFFLKQPFDR